MLEDRSSLTVLSVQDTRNCLATDRACGRCNRTLAGGSITLKGHQPSKGSYLQQDGRPVDRASCWANLDNTLFRDGMTGWKSTGQEQGFGTGPRAGECMMLFGTAGQAIQAFLIKHICTHRASWPSKLHIPSTFRSITAPPPAGVQLTSLPAARAKKTAKQDG